MLYVRKGQQRSRSSVLVDTFPVLGERTTQIAGTLSGGEQQMLALVRAYVAEPELVLVDEASLGLAPLVVDAIFAFIERIAAEGVSLLIVEQYINRALALASGVYLLHQGADRLLGTGRRPRRGAGVRPVHRGRCGGAVNDSRRRRVTRHGCRDRALLCTTPSGPCRA